MIIAYNIVLLHFYNVRFCFVIVTMWKGGFGILAFIVHCHCSMFILIVKEQCCNNIVGGLVLRISDVNWSAYRANLKLTLNENPTAAHHLITSLIRTIYPIITKHPQNGSFADSRLRTGKISEPTTVEKMDRCSCVRVGKDPGRNSVWWNVRIWHPGENWSQEHLQVSSEPWETQTLSN